MQRLQGYGTNVVWIIQMYGLSC